MRALIYSATRRVEMVHIVAPQPHDGQVCVSVSHAGICGSDVSGFLGHSRRRVPPLVLGHEFVGHLADGQRVVANPLVSCGRCRACLAGAQNLCVSWSLLGLDRTSGCFAEQVMLPTHQIFALPDSLATENAVLTEPLANIVHLFRLASPQPFFRMGIVGAGTMGALAIQVARHLGVRQLLVLDVNEARLAEATRMGATLATNSGTEEGLNKAREFADDGLDLVLDASGTGAARQTALDLCRSGGQVVFLGMAAERGELDIVTSIRREHRILMSFAYTPADFARALTLLIDGHVSLLPWTRILALEQGQMAFDDIVDRPGVTLKTLFKVVG